MDILKMAEEWGTKLITPEELMAELKKYKPLPPPPQEETKSANHYKGMETVMAIQ